MSEFLKNKYEKKIVSIKLLHKNLKLKRKKYKIILCHGNFDVVHPGHIRHLIYAKSKADILVVSITADQFIQKGIYRPFVPQDLRAMNLAAFEMVDYVVIDKNKKPLKLLKSLKPHFFAKGFEYSSSGLPPATKEEAKLVSSYGGEMIFTPGDVVYSSTNILKLSKPKINNDKLLDLMKKNKISFKDLKDIFSINKKSNKVNVHVVGDIIIDTYTSTNLIGGYTKTPTPSVLFQEKADYIGGAGVVAKHIKAAGANVSLTTVVGKDNFKNLIHKDMKNAKINLNCIVDSTRPTTNKNTILTNTYKLLKIDTLDNHPISIEILEKIKSILRNDNSDIVIFSDFRHGIFNKNSISGLIDCISKKSLKVADSQVATRWGDITEFKNFDLITPNEKETRFSLRDQDSSISELTRELYKKSKFKNLILKLGEKGTFAVSRHKKSTYSFALPSFTNNLVDAVGAGDTLLAYSSLTYFLTKSLVTANIIGSIAASCQCELEGNIEIDNSKILEKIEQIEKKSQYSIYK